MKPGQVITCVALLLCLMLSRASGVLMNTGLLIKPVRLLLQPIASGSVPLPAGGFMHARVASGEGRLLVYDNAMLSGKVIGELADGEITTVELYTQDVGKVIGSSAELFGGFVRLSLLEEIPDENSFPEGEPYQAVIKADAITGGPVDVWLDFSLTGETVGTAMPGEAVIAQDYDCGYSAEIILPSGLSGFVALEHLSYTGPCTDD